MNSEGPTPSDTSFSSFTKLPPDVLHKILFLFCDGKTLSVLAMALAASTSDFDRHIVWVELTAIAQDRLDQIAARLARCARHDSGGDALRSVAGWIRSVASVPCVDSTTNDVARIRKRMRHLSENLALLDFLQDSISEFSDEEAAQFEWPVWCGQLTVDSYTTGSRHRNTARVVITAPMKRPSWVPGSGLLGNRLPSSVLRYEHHNMVPLPPWGVVRPLLAEDELALREVARRLDESNQIAVPSGYHNTEILDIRLITKNQARRRSLGIGTIESSWMVNDKQTSYPLIACWHDDLDALSNDREYIDVIMDLLKARNRLYGSMDPSTRQYM